jgi:hypothetical protein
MRSRGIDGWLGVLLLTFGAALGSLWPVGVCWGLFVGATAVYVALNVRATRHEARRRGDPPPGPVDAPLDQMLTRPRTGRHARWTP